MEHPDAAGIDIGNESHHAAVPPTRDSRPVRRFGRTTAELEAMCPITTTPKLKIKWGTQNFPSR